MTRQLAILLSLLCLSFSSSHPSPNHFLHTKNNKGWEKFLSDEPSEFHNVELRWERNSSLPAWLQGSYVKNGPSQRQFNGENRRYSQYMDSWGKLNKFTFTGQGGPVLYSGRMIETTNYNLSAKAGKMVPSITLAAVEPKDWSLTEMMSGAMHGYDNTNVMLWRLGPEDATAATYIATTDFPLVHEVDPASLAVTAYRTPSPIRDGLSMSSCSHWRREVGADSSLQFHQMYNPLTLTPDFVLYRFGSSWDSRAEVGRFNMDYLSFIHMISNTPRYAVIVLYPVTMNFWSMPTHNMHPMETLEKVEGPTKLALMDLTDGSVIEGFETEDPSMVFATHHINAWEEGEEVVVDLSTNRWDAIAKYMEIDMMLHHEETNDEVAEFVVKRIRLNTRTRETVVQDWPETENPMMNTLDFVVINDKFTGYKNRYAYGWVSIDYWRQRLVKRDLEDPAGDRVWGQASHYPGEMFFIPDPQGSAEDDGLLITVVFDGEKEESYLLLLDAATFTEVNRAVLPTFVPFSFHGNWFPELH